MTESTELVNVKTGEITENLFTPEKLDLIKRTICKNSTDDELQLFVHVCKRSGLDPFARQIYAVKFGGVMSIQTGIDGLRLIADRTGRYAPGKAPTFTYDKDGKLESATAYVMKNVNGNWFETSATAFFEEYVNPVNKLWQSKPRIMLSKCAESLALRRAFPNETSGLYTADEMDRAGSENRPAIKAPREKTVEVPQSQGSSDLDEVVVSADGMADDEIPFAEPPQDAKVPLITEKQQKMLFTRMKLAKISVSELKDYMQKKFALEHTAGLNRQQLEDLLTWIKVKSELRPA